VFAGCGGECSVNVANDMMTLIGSLLEPNTGVVVQEKSSVLSVVSDSNTSTVTELDAPQLTNDANTSTIISSVQTKIFEIEKIKI
jgi:hypothetical protein